MILNGRMFSGVSPSMVGDKDGGVCQVANEVVEYLVVGEGAMTTVKSERM